VNYKLKRLIKDVLGWDIEGRLSRGVWLSLGGSLSSHMTVADLMVSLTTIPSRIDRVHVTIESILRQTVRPVRVALWLTAKQFPDLDKLPLSLQRQRKRGLEIYQCDTDWPHQKLLPSLVKWPDATIVTADDDLIYPVDWLRNLYCVHREIPDTVVCRRARVMGLDSSGALTKYESWPLSGAHLSGPSHVYFPTGVDGTLYPPGVLHDDVFNTTLAEKLCPRQDDIWFKIMAFRNGTKSVVAPSGAGLLVEILGSQMINLHSSNVRCGGNDIQMANVLKYFNIDPKDFIKVEGL